MDIGEVPEDR
jgi:splicing factor 3B subunit 3